MTSSNRLNSLFGRAAAAVWFALTTTTTISRNFPSILYLRRWWWRHHRFGDVIVACLTGFSFGLRFVWASIQQKSIAGGRNSPHFLHSAYGDYQRSTRVFCHTFHKTKASGELISVTLYHLYGLPFYDFEDFEESKGRGEFPTYPLPKCRKWLF